MVNSAAKWRCNWWSAIFPLCHVRSWFLSSRRCQASAAHTTAPRSCRGSLSPPESLFTKEESFARRTAPYILWSSRVAEYEYVVPKHDCRISGQTTPKYAALVLIILSCRHLRNRKSRERVSLNPPFLPKNRSSRRNSIVRNPLSGNFSTREDWLYHRRKEHQLIPHPDKSCRKLSYFPSILLRAHYLS